MTINLLSSRIKDIKEELTNLKTAHLRGLGLVKVNLVKHLYADDNISPGDIYVGTLTVEYPDDSPAYPFSYFASPDPGNLPTYDYTRGIDVLSLTYSNNGRTAIYQCRIFYGYTDLYKNTYLFTTVQPSRISGSWTLE